MYRSKLQNASNKGLIKVQKDDSEPRNRLSVWMPYRHDPRFDRRQMDHGAHSRHAGRQKEVPGIPTISRRHHDQYSGKPSETNGGNRAGYENSLSAQSAKIRLCAHRTRPITTPRPPSHLPLGQRTDPWHLDTTGELHGDVLRIGFCLCIIVDQRQGFGAVPFCVTGKAAKFAALSIQ